MQQRLLNCTVTLDQRVADRLRQLLDGEADIEVEKVGVDSGTSRGRPARGPHSHHSMRKNVHLAATPRAFAGALVGATVLALAGCKGESTGPVAVYPFDIVLERRTGTSGAPDLFLLSLATGDATRVLSGTVGGMHPSASPGGSMIAFVRTDAEFNGEIFTIGRDASGTFTGLTNISNHAADDVMPSWAPSGQRLAFVTDRAGFQDIFVVNANGTNLRRITDVDPAPAVTTEWWPAWSPDAMPGTPRIAYSSTIDGTPDIWTTTVDVTPVERERLTGTLDADVHPTWSPDGTRIAFHRIDANTGEANIVILTRASLTLQVVQIDGQQLWPAWSPEGDLIAFSSNHEGPDFEIYTMSVDGSNVVRRTDNGANDLRPTWLRRPTTP
jgi:Tol biopolymer transport system component